MTLLHSPALSRDVTITPERIEAIYPHDTKMAGLARSTRSSFQMPSHVPGYPLKAFTIAWVKATDNTAF